MEGTLELRPDGTWNLTAIEFEHSIAALGRSTQLLDIRLNPDALSESGTWTSTGNVVTLREGNQELVSFKVSLSGEVLLSANKGAEIRAPYRKGETGVVIAIRTGTL
jgi:hypothetical protein